FILSRPPRTKTQNLNTKLGLMVRTNISSSFSKSNDIPVVVVVNPALGDEKNVDDDKDLVGAFKKRLGLLSQVRKIFGSVEIFSLQELLGDP
ncbi:hypothetical protein U1Q18_003602, partial [Sarracenia purpurea var. burkii]